MLLSGLNDIMYVESSAQYLYMVIARVKVTAAGVLVVAHITRPLLW